MFCFFRIGSIFYRIQHIFFKTRAVSADYSYLKEYVSVNIKKNRTIVRKAR